MPAKPTYQYATASERVCVEPLTTLQPGVLMYRIRVNNLILLKNKFSQVEFLQSSFESRHNQIIMIEKFFMALLQPTKCVKFLGIQYM